MKNKLFIILSFILIISYSCNQQASKVINFSYFGAEANSRKNASPAAYKLAKFLSEKNNNQHVTVIFPKGKYHFFEDSAFIKEYYISNHDQDNPKKVGFALENLKNITLDGQNSEFIFHGRMIPFALLNNENITLKNIIIDFEIPALRQLKVIEVNFDTDEVIAEIYPHGNYRVENNKLIIEGEGYEYIPFTSIVFSANKRLAYMRSDPSFTPLKVEEIATNILSIKGWEQLEKTEIGERFVLRSYYRPTPGIFISECLNTSLENVTVHYAEGMGLLAQMSENINLDGFNVCLRGDSDERYFTTQADATHFSACKGLISSKNGLYEGMADDAINVHGTYLRVTKRINDKTLQLRYMHPQAWGFKWGEAGDKVQFVESEKMEIVGNHLNTINSIKPINNLTEFGAKEFEITFNDVLPESISGNDMFGIENLTWTPEVLFSNNIIRNNRARGTLFSTPRKVICENNLFDHTHGTAILLCGDCNGWFETGACKNVIIRNNKFINALSSNYQFTNAVISIYPEIPKLEDQKSFFHSEIIIENNHFEMFDRPVLYAKSTDGLIFRNNNIEYNNDFEAFHWNKYIFFFEKVANIKIKDNNFAKKLVTSKDIKINLSAPNAVIVEQK